MDITIFGNYLSLLFGFLFGCVLTATTIMLWNPCKEYYTTIRGGTTTDDLYISEADVGEFEIDKKRIKEICDAGHTNHCAQRQVWGDGECECEGGLK